MTLVFERDLQFSHLKRGHYLIVIGTTGELLLDIDHHRVLHTASFTPFINGSVLDHFSELEGNN